jgi:hypothetical protein
MFLCPLLGIICLPCQHWRWLFLLMLLAKWWVKVGANLANIRKVSSHFLIYLSFILWKRKIIHWPLLLVSTTASVNDSYYTLKLLVCIDIVALDICRAVVAESLPFWIDLMSIKLWSLCFLSVACFIVMYFSFAFAKIKILRLYILSYITVF